MLSHSGDESSGAFQRHSQQRRAVFWSFTFKNPNSAATAEFSLSEFQHISTHY
jgi:hypothetical protein